MAVMGLFSSCAAPPDQLTDRSQFFRFGDLRLQTFQIGEGFPRVVEQAEQFAIEQALAHENHDRP